VRGTRSLDYALLQSVDTIIGDKKAITVLFTNLISSLSRTSTRRTDLSYFVNVLHERSVPGVGA
jgi:hypothetical protein